jgi:hypothetical protein
MNKYNNSIKRHFFLHSFLTRIERKKKAPSFSTITTSKGA